jgi:epoxyqueuosine reductase
MSFVEKIKEKAHCLGFSLAGVTTSDPPPHWPVFQHWLALGRNGSMDYLHDPRRAEPQLVLPGCKSILVLGMRHPKVANDQRKPSSSGYIAAYARGEDYHIAIPAKLKILERFIEQEAGMAVSLRSYTDTGPLLERDLAQRAGLGWIGKNTCLINPKIGSFFFLAEILLDIELDADQPFTADRCGSCTRCIEACPTACILPDRTLDANRCISYLTIENKGEIPPDLRSKVGNWIFGCDICQEVCPWNQDTTPIVESIIEPRRGIPVIDLTADLSLTAQEFNKKFKTSPILRARRGGYLRNVSVVLGNQKDPASIPALEIIAEKEDELVRLHARWALEQIRKGRIS